MQKREKQNIGSPSRPVIEFRRYQTDDLLACARLAAQAWPASLALASKDFEISSMMGYVEFSVSGANWTDVAYTPEGIIGFLFGRIDGYHGAESPRRSRLGELPSAVKSSLDRGRITLGHLKFLWNLILTEAKLKLVMPRSDASIEIFIVGSKHRGKGIGMELIDRFFRAARESGASLMTVCTDDRVSNWQFYERRGFRRIGTFYDNITSHYTGLDARGIVFSLDLDKK